jgi:hypothetical protein
MLLHLSVGNTIIARDEIMLANDDKTLRISSYTFPYIEDPILFSSFSP